MTEVSYYYSQEMHDSISNKFKESNAGEIEINVGNIVCISFGVVSTLKDDSTIEMLDVWDKYGNHIYTEPGSELILDFNQFYEDDDDFEYDKTLNLTETFVYILDQYRFLEDII